MVIYSFSLDVPGHLKKEYYIVFPAGLPYHLHVASLREHNCCPSAQHRPFADNQQGTATLISHQTLCEMYKLAIKANISHFWLFG